MGSLTRRADYPPSFLLLLPSPHSPHFLLPFPTPSFPFSPLPSFVLLELPEMNNAYDFVIN